MIRLRAAMFRGLAHPWLGPVVLLLLAVLMALVLLHVLGDQLLEANGLVCLLVVCVLTAVVPSLRIVSRVRPKRIDCQRGPPTISSIFAVLAPSAEAVPSPLRL